MSIFECSNVILMATVNFKLQSKSENSHIYLVLSAGRGKTIFRKTGKIINYKHWSSRTGLPNQNDPQFKNLTIELRNLKTFILNNIDDSKTSTNKELGDWLAYSIDLHFERIKEEDENNSLVDYIQRVIDFADTKVLRGGKIGLSANRVKGYVTFKGVIEAYQKHINKELKLKDIDPVFEVEFRNWLLKTKKYSRNYAGKNFDNLKAVCSDAERIGRKVHPHAKNILSFSEIKDDRVVITLSFNELETISILEDLPPHLENTRKWLLLGCEIGQRGGDLLSITKENLNNRDGILFLDIKQQKTGKEIPIVVKPSIKKIIDGGLPYKISIQKFNDYLKDLCELAEIDTPTKGKIYDKEKGRKVSKMYPKYKLITSHICRRSFATNYYKQVPTPLLMVTTGHSKESLFLDYIGEKEDKDADAKLLYKYAMIFEKERQKQKKKRSKMQVIKNV